MDAVFERMLVMKRRCKWISISGRHHEPSSGNFGRQHAKQCLNNGANMQRGFPPHFRRGEYGLMLDEALDDHASAILVDGAGS